MKRAAAVALMLLATSSLGWAQSADEHKAHHPEQKEAPSATQPSPPADTTGMGQGTTGHGGMMNMMGGRIPMMDMMQMMGMMRQSGAGMDGMPAIDHVEGRIAFLRAELKITDAQTTAWNAFAEALRANAEGLGEVRASMMMSQMGAAQPSLVDRLALQEKWLAARLEGTRAIKSALVNLVGTLADEQKKTADELLAPQMGMMSMATAMQSGPMGSSQMKPEMMMPGR